MIENANKSQIHSALDFSLNCSFAKATRRIIYNFSEEFIEERGHFHVDVMSGIGSGLVIYQNYRFFLLTAKHNIEQLYPIPLRNESPIWVPIDHPPIWRDMNDFFMGRRIWHIGELIEQSDYFNSEDIVLIEFFCPLRPQSLPRQFINVNDPNYFIKKECFFEKQILACSGFPANSNLYHEVNNNSEITQSTNFNLVHMFGLFFMDEIGGFIHFDEAQNVNSEILNGMSGGPVFSVFNDESELKLAGITLTGGDNKLRFIPAYVLHDAIGSYKTSRCEVIDEASYIADETERPDLALAMFCELENADENFRIKLGLPI